MIKKTHGLAIGCLSLISLLGLAACTAPVGPKGDTAPSIYAQQGKCRNHAAFSTLKTIKQPL